VDRLSPGETCDLAWPALTAAVVYDTALGGRQAVWSCSRPFRVCKVGLTWLAKHYWFIISVPRVASWLARDLLHWGFMIMFVYGIEAPKRRATGREDRWVITVSTESRDDDEEVYCNELG